MTNEEARDQIVIFMCILQKVINDRDKQALEMAIQALEQSSGDTVSRQAVNEIINDIRDCISVEGYCAILERLKKLPSVTQKSETVTEFADRCRECGAKYGKLLKQQPCDDCISRQAVLETLDDMDNVLDEDRTIENYKELLKECYEVLPSVKPQEKTGHWKMMYEPENMVVCSECGKCAYLYNGRTSTWCPHCGNYKGAKNDT